MISEDIDLADSDDGFADVKRIELPVHYARHDILIQELTRVEHVSTPCPIVHRSSHTHTLRRSRRQNGRYKSVCSQSAPLGKLIEAKPREWKYLIEMNYDDPHEVAFP